MGVDYMKIAREIAAKNIQPKTFKFGSNMTPEELNYQQYLID